MRKFMLITLFLFWSNVILVAQSVVSKVTNPEHSNEIYLFSKDSNKLARLEKTEARMEIKAKGMGGVENGYELEGEKSIVRIRNTKDLSFIFYAGGTSAAKSNGVNSVTDSLMRSMGINSSMMSMSNPMQTSQSGELAELYSVRCAKGKRKLTVKSEDSDPQAANGVIQSAPSLMQAGSKGGLAMGAATVGIGVGMKLLGKAKKESVKYTITIKKIREGFYEILTDKNLPKGEYAFILNDSGGMGNMSTLFAFGIE